MAGALDTAVYRVTEFEWIDPYGRTSPAGAPRERVIAFAPGYQGEKAAEGAVVLYGSVLPVGWQGPFYYGQGYSYRYRQRMERGPTI